MRTAEEALVEKVIGFAIEVHRCLGPGLLESAYEGALAYELHSAGLDYQKQAPVDVLYKGEKLAVGFRADLIVDAQLVLELKTVERLLPIHTAQLITYLKLLNIKRGFLLNFNAEIMKHGIKRVSI